MDAEFSPDQRAGLGLAEGESVRVLASGDRTILLERVAVDGPRAYPWDRDLVLDADVRAFTFAGVLQLIHASAKSGFLAFEHAEHSKSVYLHRGEVVFAASNQPVDRLGACLLRNGVLTPEQYREADRGYRPDGHYGRVLVERGFLTPREIWNGVKIQVEEIVRSMFSYGAGQVLFWEGEVRPDNVVRLSLPTERLIEEGLKRRDELLKFLALLEDPRIRLEIADGANLSVSETERAIYAALRSETRFEAVSRRAGIDPLTTARTIQLLRLLGAVRVERVGVEDSARQEAALRASGEESLRECVSLYVKLMAELVSPIVAVEGASALRARLCPVTAEAARRYPGILEGVEVGPQGTVDPEFIIERALRFPGDRENEVRMALGELVSYLEFDLLNHPDIEDPQVFLDGVEPLREQL